ncbi:hypothetical protein [Paraburkholderia phenazinium]|uniref:hypothetical protein n=1 Tax=Paraburkholderia phenazinium TaxID=60549 RepID=UPI00158AEF06|nr:hypothetical protein [Paraburkholderia phenazinium]
MVHLVSVLEVSALFREPMKSHTMQCEGFVLLSALTLKVLTHLCQDVVIKKDNADSQNKKNGDADELATNGRANVQPLNLVLRKYNFSCDRARRALPFVLLRAPFPGMRNIPLRPTTSERRLSSESASERITETSSRARSVSARAGWPDAHAHALCARGHGRCHGGGQHLCAKQRHAIRDH